MRLRSLALAFGAIAASAAPAFADDRSNFAAAVKPMLALTSYRMHMTGSMHGKPDARTFEFVAPDRIHMTGSGRTPEIISIGSKAWMRFPGGGWTPSPVAIGAMIKTMRDPANIHKLANDFHETYTDAGMGSYRGQSAHLYRSTAKVGGISTESTIYVMSDHLVHHIDMTGAGGTQSIDYTDFDSTSISIVPPI